RHSADSRLREQRLSCVANEARNPHVARYFDDRCLYLGSEHQRHRAHSKEFAVTERVRFRLRGSSFNLWNHPVFSAPNTQFGTGNFGRIFSQSNLGRQTELALRMVF
ncbi:MAG TPA: hypothetical protein VE621_04295, partial [Bryobacteraceae bacterium]|nr:hypothetical protein [Bryobacteraceae bacterium]